MKKITSMILALVFSVSVILSAALELNRKGYIEIVQAEQFGEIYFKGSEEAVH